MKVFLEVQYEAGMGMGSKRFKPEELQAAIDFARESGGTVYRIEEIWSV